MKDFLKGFEKRAGIGGAMKTMFRAGVSPKAISTAAPKVVGPMPAKSLSAHAQNATANITKKNYASIPDVTPAAAPKKKILGLF